MSFKPAWLLEADKLEPTIIVEEPSFDNRVQKRSRRRNAGYLTGHTEKALHNRRRATHWVQQARIDAALRAQREREARSAELRAYLEALNG